VHNGKQVGLYTYVILFVFQYQVLTTVMDNVAVPSRCIYACAVVFFDATVFSVNKDLYINSAVQSLADIYPLQRSKGAIVWGGNVR